MVRERLADLIRERGWTQSEFARQLGEPVYWVHDRTSGRTKIAADELPKMAEVLGIPVAAFFPVAERPTVKFQPVHQAPGAREMAIRAAKEIYDTTPSVPASPEEIALEDIAIVLRRYKERIRTESNHSG